MRSDSPNYIREDQEFEVSKEEIRTVIREILDREKDNEGEIALLVLECTSLLTAKRAHVDSLGSQSLFKKKIFEVTGKNDSVRMAILKKENEAQFAFMELINYAIELSRSNSRLACAVQKELENYYKEIKQDNIELRQDIQEIREAFISQFNMNRRMEEAVRDTSNLANNIDRHIKIWCPACGYQLLEEQIICPRCGRLHVRKTQELPEDLRKGLNHISSIVKNRVGQDTIHWSEEAEQISEAIEKTLCLFEAGQVLDYLELKEQDIKIEYGKKITKTIKTLTSLKGRCQTPEYHVALIGEMKAGKSTLLNALLQEDIASVAVNAETAVLTKLKYSSNYYIRVEFYNRTEWDRIKSFVEQEIKQGDKSKQYLEVVQHDKSRYNHVDEEPITLYADNPDHLRQLVYDWTSVKAPEHFSVREVEIGIPSNGFHVPKEVVFWDTPGLQDPVKYRSDATKKCLQGADTVIIVIPAGDLNTQTEEMISEVFHTVGRDTSRVYLVATKKDEKSYQEWEEILSKWQLRFKEIGIKQSKQQWIFPTSALLERLLQKYAAHEKAGQEMTAYEKGRLLFACQYALEERGLLSEGQNYQLDNLAYMSDHRQVLEAEFGVGLLKKSIERALERDFLPQKRENVIQSFSTAYNELLGVILNILHAPDVEITKHENAIRQLQETIYNMTEQKEAADKELSEVKAVAEYYYKSLSARKQSVMCCDRKSERKNQFKWLQYSLSEFPELQKRIGSRDYNKFEAVELIEQMGSQIQTIIKQRIDQVQLRMKKAEQEKKRVIEALNLSEALRQDMEKKRILARESLLCIRYFWEHTNGGAMNRVAFREKERGIRGNAGGL